MGKHNVLTLHDAYQRYKRLPDASALVLAAMDTIFDRLMTPPTQKWHEHICHDCEDEFECNCVSDPEGQYPTLCAECDRRHGAEVDGDMQAEMQREDEALAAEKAKEDDDNQARCYEVKS